MIPQSTAKFWTKSKAAVKSDIMVTWQWEIQRQVGNKMVHSFN